MSHHIYTTAGCVLGSVSFGESHTFFQIFTRELGLIGASARSVKAVQSKLRYGLQDFSLSTVSLVRGKYEWKITNVVPMDNIYYSLRGNERARTVCIHALSLIKKLVVGEEKNEQLYDILSSAFRYIQTHNLSVEELRNVECILMLRIVHNLGYVHATETLMPFVLDTVWSKELVSGMSSYQHNAVQDINKAIRESQL